MKEKKTVNDQLSESLDVEFELEKKEQPKMPIVKIEEDVLMTKEKMDKDLGKDYSSVRRNLRNLIDIGEEAIDGIINVATESDSPRAYEVAGQMIKAVADMNKDLLDMHQKVKTINKEDIKVTNNTTNSIYVGSTSELQDIINQSRSAKKTLKGCSDIIDGEIIDKVVDNDE